MKQKTFRLLTGLSFFFILNLTLQSVQAQISQPRSTYLNFNYVTSKLKQDGVTGSLKSDYGAAITIGNTFYLHKKPILNMVRFGIDWTYFDLNFVQYSQDIYDEYAEKDKAVLYQGEAGMHIGASVTATPVKGLNISAYFRYSPSFSAHYNDYQEEFKYAYASFFVTGISASYKVISLGVENRWGKSEFKFDMEDDYNESYSYKQKMKTSAIRFYLGFRF